MIIRLLIPYLREQACREGTQGPVIWAALPPDAQMPLLRPGSEGDPVAALQRVLTEQAPGRWDVSPQAVTGVFDATTSAAVQAFQRWNGISADGLVGDQTWAAPADSTGTSLETGACHQSPRAGA